MQIVRIESYGVAELLLQVQELRVGGDGRHTIKRFVGFLLGERRQAKGVRAIPANELVKRPQLKSKVKSVATQHTGSTLPTYQLLMLRPTEEELYAAGTAARLTTKFRLGAAGEAIAIRKIRHGHGVPLPVRYARDETPRNQTQSDPVDTGTCSSRWSKCADSGFAGTRMSSTMGQTGRLQSR